VDTGQGNGGGGGEGGELGAETGVGEVEERGRTSRRSGSWKSLWKGRKLEKEEERHEEVAFDD